MDRLENIIPSKETQSQKNTHGLYACTDKWILAQKHGIPKIQFTNHMELKKSEDQSVGASVIRKRNKILTGANTKYRTETKRKAIQRWAPPGDPSHI
jgi:hypothetical protein